MARIYGCAEMVRISAREGFECALAGFARLVHTYGHAECLPGDIQATEEILTRPWFSRLWILQEATLNPICTLVYGSKRLPFSVLSGLYHNVIRAHFFHVRFSEEIRGCLLTLRIMYYISTASKCSTASDLLTLMQYSRSQKCQVPSDHVYGLSGVHQFLGSAFGRVDYDLDVSSLYAKTRMDGLIETTSGQKMIDLAAKQNEHRAASHSSRT